MKSITFSIGIPAYNEAGNIGYLLESIGDQKLDKKLHLSEITVISDGSIDNTVKIARKIKNKKIKILEYKNREGKNTRLNHLYKNLKEDVFILLDADIKFGDENVLINLLQPFIKFKNLGLVAGNSQPIKANNLVEAGINNFVYALNFMKKQIKNGNNIYSVRGPLLAVSKKFARNITLPLDVPDDRYLYLRCIQNGFKFYFVNDAVVFYKSPKTISDQLNQGQRFRRDRNNLDRYFKKNFLLKQYEIPIYLRLLMLLYQVIKNPLAYLVMKYMHLLILYRNKFSKNYKWNMVLSTKKFN